jgi:3-phenylpropionate/cinnamic acid dioxygenase small subunit
MSAEEQIRWALAKYAQSLDDHDVDTYVSLFSRSATLHLKSGETVGYDGLSENLSQVYAAEPKGHRTKHILSSPLINVEGTNAEVISDVVVYECFDDFPWAVKETGRYVDRFIEEDGRWLFCEKRLEGDSFVLERAERSRF